MHKFLKKPHCLKLLSDKRKFEILRLLKSHGKYNLEIAETLRKIISCFEEIFLR